MKNRREKLLDGLDLARLAGAEIGPLHNPIVSKAEGHVIYVDHKDTESLRTAWAQDKAVDVSKIYVDAIWGTQTLEQAIATYAKANGHSTAPLLLDYVVASHVVEHVPDLVTWLQEIRSILKPGGEVRLAIPDRRFTFDYMRRTSDLAHVLSAYISRARVPSPQCILDFGLNMAPVDCAAAWRGEIDETSLQRKYTFAEAMAYAQDAVEHGTYHDVHCWVFTPTSFADMCVELARHGLLDFACETFHDTAVNEFEFFVTMRVCQDPEANAASWQRMAAVASAHYDCTTLDQ